MTRIGLISDTHGYLDEQVLKYFENCDEIWHAGDFGNLEVADRLRGFKPLRGVYGNIDGPDLRHAFPEKMNWATEGLNVFLIHIGGYPPKYTRPIRDEIIRTRTGLFICGHSHILKIIYDPELHCLHINPGAAGNHGWHKTRTLVRFTIDGKEIKDCQVIELGKRG